MNTLRVNYISRVKRLQGLDLKVAPRQRDPKMDAIVRAVHRSPHFDVAAAAAAVTEALAASSEKAHA